MWDRLPACHQEQSPRSESRQDFCRHRWNGETDERSRRATLVGRTQVAVATQIRQAAKVMGNSLQPPYRNSAPLCSGLQNDRLEAYPTCLPGVGHAMGWHGAAGAERLRLPHLRFRTMRLTRLLHRRLDQRL